MMSVDTVLQQREAKGDPIRVGMVGAGATGRAIALHVVDGVGLVHAMLLRIQALLLPIRTLVLSGH